MEAGGGATSCEELGVFGVFEELALSELSDEVAVLGVSVEIVLSVEVADAGGVDVAGMGGVDDGVEVDVLVASRTSLHAELSVSVLTDVVVSLGKTTFHEKWSVTAVGVRDSSLDWNDPQKICASAWSRTAELSPEKESLPCVTSGWPAAFPGFCHPPRQTVG